MAINTTIYIADEDIAQRTGFISSRYRTQDGRFILNHQDLRRVPLSTEEVINGLGEKVRVISKSDAEDLIKKNNYATGAVVQQEEETNENEEE